MGFGHSLITAPPHRKMGEPNSNEWIIPDRSCHVRQAEVIWVHYNRPRTVPYVLDLTLCLTGHRLAA